MSHATPASMASNRSPRSPDECLRLDCGTLLSVKVGALRIPEEGLQTAGGKFKREREVDGSVRRSHGEDEAQRILSVGLRNLRDSDRRFGATA
jgi:hypothetical protein